MAHYSIAASRVDAFDKTSATTNAPSKRGLFRRILDAVILIRQQQADREIARFLQSRGGKLTDEAEREIANRFLSRPSDQFHA